MPVSQASVDAAPRPDDDCLRRVRDVACWWSEVGASSNCPSLELRERLLDLRPHLAKYVASHEGHGNLLLLADLDQLIGRLRVCRPSQICWINLSHTIGIFLSQLGKLDGSPPAN